MNKNEFLTRLKNSLEKNGLPQEDMDDALNYYEEIFMDAGFGRDDETAESLGSPEVIAEGILRENGIEINNINDFTKSTNVQQNVTIVQKSSSDTALKIVLLILAFPIWFPIVVVIFSLLIALFALIFGLGIAFVATSVAMLFSGIMILFESPALALMGIGVGLVGCGITFFILCGLVPASLKLFKKFFSALKGMFKKGDK